MSQKITYVCDRCGAATKEKPTYPSGYSIYFGRTVYDKKDKDAIPAFSNTRLDLCNKCQKSFNHWFKQGKFDDEQYIY